MINSPSICRFCVGHYIWSNQCNDTEADEFSGVNAIVDDLRVYSRALSAGEPKALYAEK